jgi:hypothetical protein
MQSKGDLLRMKIHAHNSVFEEVRRNTLKRHVVQHAVIDTLPVLHTL